MSACAAVFQNMKTRQARLFSLRRKAHLILALASLVDLICIEDFRIKNFLNAFIQTVFGMRIFIAIRDRSEMVV